ncbi:MAG TPA: GNAT family N-acetyltransferase [Pyrinomonadaceae bacterium]|nr:GNAT family N-acetyltransferase [Pyrinomonadaceae bacterium]
MNFTEYTPGHLPAVIEIFRSNIPKYFGPGEEPGLRGFLEDTRGSNYYVGKIDGEVLAAGGVALNENQTVSLCWGMIRSDHLGTGLGRKLTEFRIEKAREIFGPLPLFISTSQHTQGFYEKFGFRLTMHKTDGFGPGIDICEMLRET